ncbi:hypothetical protein AMRN_1733 [Malaciobacter marinus]|uniref:Uncharacterized protein n=1 Tax=Malaciobacter marinus TaxID=505249 RepID=A0A347TLI4_9BACT|nr:hypothetical protein [Malaciobacter marinus]AXX87462.1 hypothetical protein AMRN_1733 [Malaciobacter marinus]PHO16201.1 hypothetical protein CPH92_02535 [Malaciobacter marinus]
MGVKVNNVLDKHTLEEVNVKNGYHGDFICKTKNCNADMIFVREHEKRRLEKTIFVPSFFKLKSNKNQHDENCSFNTKGIMKVIARNSDSNILKSLDENKYEFSLQILHKPAKKSSSIEPTTDNENYNNTPTKRKTTQYVNKGTASSYIKTLKSILELRAKIEEENELASIITLKYNSKKIYWNKFFFNHTRYIEAYKLNQNSPIKYPICIHGKVSKVIKKNDKFKFDKIKLHNPYIELLSKITEMPSIELLISSEDVELDKFKNDTEILIYGQAQFSTSQLWTPLEEREQEEPKKVRFLKIELWINYNEQIMLL